MKAEKVNGIRFSPAHLPIGTIALVQVMADPYELRVDRLLEQSAQGWLIESDEDPDVLTNGHVRKKMVNVSWVKGIVKRGTGHCNTTPYHTPTPFTQKRYEKQQPYAERAFIFGKKKNEYVFDDIVSDINSILFHYPQYAQQRQQHLFDVNAIAGQVLKHARVSTWYSVIINKKKFHRVLKAAMARFKSPRAEAQRAYRAEQDRMGEELMRDMYEHDEKMLDDEERKFLAEHEENIFQNDGLDDAHFECMLGGDEPSADAPEDEEEPLLQPAGVAYRESESYDPHGESNTIVMDNTYKVRG
jgi:Icc-related predicted phosphoesterase